MTRLRVPNTSPTNLPIRVCKNFPKRQKLHRPFQLTNSLGQPFGSVRCSSPRVASPDTCQSTRLLETPTPENLTWRLARGPSGKVCYTTTSTGYSIKDRPMKLGMRFGIWGFVSASLLVTERQPLQEPQRRPSPSGPPVSRVKIGSGVENACGGAWAALKCGVDRQGARPVVRVVWRSVDGAVLDQTCPAGFVIPSAVGLMHAKCPNSAAVVRLSRGDPQTFRPSIRPVWCILPGCDP